jgi:hypothetical protein
MVAQIHAQQAVPPICTDVVFGADGLLQSQWLSLAGLPAIRECHITRG